MRAALVVWLALLVLPASAGAVTTGFDDLPSGTVLTNQYASLGGAGQGVVFGPLPGGAGDGFRPKVWNPDSPVPASGVNVARLDNCVGTGNDCEFFTPGTTGTFATPRTTVSVKVGYLGPAPASPCAAGSTDGDCAQLTLTAYDSAGMPVGTPSSGMATSGRTAQTTLTVTTTSAVIVGFRLRARDGTDSNKPVVMDDLKWETDPGQPPPPPDFTVTLSEQNPIITQGGQAVSTVQITRLNGSTGPIALAVSGLPPSVESSIEPSGDTATLRLTATAATPPTTTPATFTVTGTPGNAQAGSAPRSASTTLQVRQALQLLTSSPADVTLAPCRAEVTLQVVRDARFPGPVNVTVSDRVGGIGGLVTPRELTFPNGALAQDVKLILIGEPTGLALGPVPVTVTATGKGVPIQRQTFTVRGTCPVTYDARITSMHITQGTQTLFRPGRTAGNPDAIFKYADLANEAKLTHRGQTVVRVFANLASGPAAGVPRVPVVLHGADADGNPLPYSPVLPVSGPRTLKIGAQFLDDFEQNSETDVYSFVVPHGWYDEESGISLRAELRPPTGATGAANDPVATQCTTAECVRNDFFTIRDIPFGEVRPVQIKPIELRVNNVAMPSPDTVFAWVRQVTPFEVRTQPYAATLDISDLAGEADKDVRNRGAAYRTGDWVCDNSAPSNGWVVGVNTGVARGLTARDYDCSWSFDSPSLAVVEYKRPLTSVGHELHHLFGRPHAARACGAEKPENGSAEDWPPDEMGFTQSIGLDTRQGSGIAGGPFAVMSPRPGYPFGQWFDLMSYCANSDRTEDLINGPKTMDAWVSVRNWNKLYDSRVQTRRAPVRRQAASVPSLRVVAYVDGSGADIASVSPVDSPPQPATGSRFRLRALGAGGAVLADVTMHEGSDHVDGAPAALPLFGIVPAAGVERVEVSENGTVVASRARSALPTVAVDGVPSFKGGEATMRWTMGDPDGGPLSVSVAYATDDDFQRIYAGVGTQSVTVPARYLPRAIDGRIRVTVNDGFSSVSATSKPFRSPGGKPVVRILSPAPGAAQPVDAPLVLSGEAFDDTGAALTGKRLVWRAGKRVLGRGERATATGLDPTRAAITLTATDRFGRRTVAALPLKLRPAAPIFLRLDVPKRVGRRARAVRLRVATSLPARLRVRGQRFRVSRKARTVRVRIPRGRKPLVLRLVLDGRVTIRRVAR